MIIDDHFEIDAPIERVWPVLCDPQRVAACIPNAEITEIVDARTYRGKLSIKVGPIAVTYAASIVVDDFDPATRTARLRIDGDEVRGRGGIAAAVISRVVSRPGGTLVELRTDAQIGGAVANLGPRLIEGVARLCVAEFAANLSGLV